MISSFFFVFFFFNDTATTEIYTLSLHDALPISRQAAGRCRGCARRTPCGCRSPWRSEEHTSELQSRRDLVCRLLLEKKKKKKNNIRYQNKKNANLSSKSHSTSIRLYLRCLHTCL